MYGLICLGIPLARKLVEMPARAYCTGIPVGGSRRITAHQQERVTNAIWLAVVFLELWRDARANLTLG